MANNLNDYFDEIYCTNLDSRLDRWTQVSARFLEHEICVRRFSAADGNSADLVREFSIIRTRLAEARKSEPKYLKNSRALGCLISGMQIIEDAIRKGHQKILLFDDDVVFHRGFEGILSSMANLPHWKLLYLGCSQHSWEGIEMSGTHTYAAKHTHGTFAVGVDASIFDEILNLYSEKEKNCDVYLMEIQDRYPLECPVLFPNLVIADVRESSIRGARSQSAHADKVKWQLTDYELDSKHFAARILETLGLGRIGCIYRALVAKLRWGR
jgi:GR25 family glycosyltransferase involved in LPS biosynthesis